MAANVRTGVSEIKGFKVLSRRHLSTISYLRTTVILILYNN